VAEEARPKSNVAGHSEHLGDVGEDFAAVRKLAQNADLHA
jgi:hypothetical protein